MCVIYTSADMSEIGSAILELFATPGEQICFQNEYASLCSVGINDEPELVILNHYKYW